MASRGGSFRVATPSSLDGPLPDGVGSCFIPRLLLSLDHAAFGRQLFFKGALDPLRGDYLFQFVGKGWNGSLHKVGDQHRHRGGLGS